MRSIRLAALALLAATPLAGQVSGSQIYQTKCASCHDQGSVRAPGPALMAMMSPRAILAALTQGSMRTVGADLSEDERRSVSEYLSRRQLAVQSMPATAYCTDGAAVVAPGPGDWTAWGGSPTGTGFRLADQAGLAAATIPSLKLKWAFAFPGGSVTRSQPSIVGQVAIVGSQFGEVYGLDAATGCIRWVFEGAAAVRGVVAVGDPDREGRRIAVAADFRSEVIGLDAATGKRLWSTRIGDHPLSNVTGSPVIHGTSVYVPISSMEVTAAQNPEYRCCSSSGGVVALDLRTGAVLWRYRVIAEEAKEVGTTAAGKPIFGPAGAPIWSSPTVDSRRGLLYVGTGENYTHPTTATSDAIIALDLGTGRQVWSFQATSRDAFNMACGSAQAANCPVPNGPDVDFGQAPLLTTRADGKEVLIVGQKLGVVYALDPDRRGTLLWQRRVGRGGALGGVHWGVSAGGGRVFAPVSDRVTSVDPAGQARPGLHALDLETGAPLWSQAAPPCLRRLGCFAAFSAAPTAVPDAVFVGGLDGWLRAYAARDGQLLWEFDAGAEFQTINGIPGKGGAIDGPAVTVANGMVYLSAGYGLFGQIAGNVLLAFQVDR